MNRLCKYCNKPLTWPRRYGICDDCESLIADQKYQQRKDDEAEKRAQRKEKQDDDSTP
jgi:hypothetical protein